MNCCFLLLVATVSAMVSRAAASLAAQFDSIELAPTFRFGSASFRLYTRAAATTQMKVCEQRAPNADRRCPHLAALQQLLAQMAQESAKQQAQGIVAVTGAPPAAVQPRATTRAATKHRRAAARAARLARANARALA